MEVKLLRAALRSAVVNASQVRVEGFGFRVLGLRVFRVDRAQDNRNALSRRGTRAESACESPAVKWEGLRVTSHGGSVCFQRVWCVQECLYVNCM